MDLPVVAERHVDFDLASDHSTLQVGPFIFHVSGVQISGTPTFEEWELAMNVLGTVDRRVVKPFKLWVAVMLLTGEAQYGETYTQAIESTGLAYSTLANARSTVRKYLNPANLSDLSAWHPNLSFEHHVIVQSLPPADREEWLRVAELEHMTSDELRQAVHRGETKSHSEFCCPSCGTSYEVAHPVKIVKTLKRGSNVKE